MAGDPQRPWSGRASAAATIAARLRFDAVECRFDGHPAVAGITLEVAPGEIVCLLGPSGCGKTTLLRLAAGIERPSAGRILLDDRVVAGDGQFVPPEARNVGLMFQDFALFPHLSVLENVAFGLRALPKADARSAALAALERVGLARLADLHPHTLSGGEQQRVALARAIAPRPRVLLMDEPFSGLDVQLRELMREETLAILQETRATSVIVTHDPDEALMLGDRIAVMREGRIVQIDTAEELYRHPRDLFVARFFSEVNEVAVRVEQGRLTPNLGDVDIAGMREGETGVLCIRQRGIHLTEPGTGRAGRVRNVRFRGDLAVIEVAVAGLERPLKARVRDGHAPAKGADVGVIFSEGALLLFPDKPGPAGAGDGRRAP
ncbi:MAG: ATP-binding cassette domain-containing protein [Rhizobiales bacterium]|nr:ATP-binding cassette domain-containing protein [Hyphomicrobiales bacterium]